MFSPNKAIGSALATTSCVQDFDAALGFNPNSVKALYHKGQVLQGLHKAAVSRI
jgi:hypothetical protein